MNALLAYMNRVRGSALRRNTMMTLGRQIAAAVAQLSTVILIARVLGPEGNGLYAMALLLPSLLATFLNLGVGPATVYFIGRGSVSAARAVKENLQLAVRVSVIGAVVSVPLILMWGDALFPGIPFELLVAGLLAFPVSLLLSYWNTVLQGLEDFRAFNWTILAPSYVTLAAAAFALLVLDGGILAAVVAYLLGQVAGLAVVWIFVRRIGLRPDELDEISHYKRTLLTYGWKAHLSNIITFINYRSDILLVNFFLAPTATGLYVIAVQMAERLWMLSQAASTVLFPRLSAMRADPAARYRLAIRAATIVVSLTFVAASALAALLHFLLVPVFGAEYQDSYEPFLWLLPGIITFAGARVLSNAIAASGRPEWNFYVSLLVVNINILGNVLLIPIFGLAGAALATTLAYTLDALMKFALVQLTRSSSPNKYFKQ